MKKLLMRAANLNAPHEGGRYYLFEYHKLSRARVEQTGARCLGVVGPKGLAEPFHKNSALPEPGYTHVSAWAARANMRDYVLAWMGSLHGLRPWPPVVLRANRIDTYKACLRFYVQSHLLCQQTWTGRQALTDVLRSWWQEACASARVDPPVIVQFAKYLMAEGGGALLPGYGYVVGDDDGDDFGLPWPDALQPTGRSFQHGEHFRPNTSAAEAVAYLSMVSALRECMRTFVARPEVQALYARLSVLQARHTRAVHARVVARAGLEGMIEARAQAGTVMYLAAVPFRGHTYAWAGGQLVLVHDGDAIIPNGPQNMRLILRQDLPRVQNRTTN